MWRQLHLEYKGSGELISASGRKVLQYFPRCRNMGHLSAHLDSWKQLVEDYGSMIALHVPEQSKTMLFAVIPEEIETELEHPLKAHIKTPDQITEYCKAKTVKSRRKLLAARKLKAISATTSGGRMSPLVEPPTADMSEPIPSWAQPIVAALSKPGGDRGRGGKGQAPSRSRTPSPSTRPRSPSPPDFKPKGKLI